VQAVDRWVVPAWLFRLDDGSSAPRWGLPWLADFDGDDPLPDSSLASLYSPGVGLPHGLVDAEQQIEPSGAQGARPGRSPLARG
jgi:hypothetical protein